MVEQILKDYDKLNGEYLGSGQNGDSFRIITNDYREINIKFTESKSEYTCTKRLFELQKKDNSITEITTEIYVCDKVNSSISKMIPDSIKDNLKHKPTYIIIKENVLVNDRITEYLMRVVFVTLLNFCKKNDYSFHDITNYPEHYNHFLLYIKAIYKQPSFLRDIEDLIEIMKIYNRIKADDLHSGNIGRDLFSGRLKAFDFDTIY